MGLCDMPTASMYVTHAWPVFCKCVSLWPLAGERMMVRDHSMTLCNCITISPELVGKAAPVGLRECGLEEGKEPLQAVNAKPLPS